MNKTKIILAAIGGVCGVAALVLAYLIWDGCSQQNETREELVTMQEAIAKHVKAEIKPVKASVDAIEENRKAYADWALEAMALAVRGDKKFEPTSEATFKQFMVAEAHRLSELPGGVEGKLVKPSFPFGFQQYILDGAMPPAADIKKLQRQWDDVTTVVTTLADAGVYELVSITIKEGASAAVQKAEEKPQGRNANRRNRQQPKKEAAQQQASDDEPDVTVMAVEFLTRPAGLVTALNSFAVNARFCVVDDFRFAREKDDLLDALGGEKKAEAAQPASRGRGRGRRAAAQEEAQPEDEDDDSAKKGQLVTDPLKASLLKVGMTVKIYDFKSLSAPAPAKED